MPACIAHYQFGQDVLDRLGDDLRSLAAAYKQAFDIGLQGPDIFFFYKPYRRTKIRDYGAARHNEPAVRMFAPILAKIRDGAALSYLLGLICHYVLDKRCHPFVYEHSYVPYDHQRMESAFDRHLLHSSGLMKTRYHYLPVGSLDYAAMASLWPGIDANTLRKCVKAERRAIRLLDHRKFLEACERVLGKPGALTPMTLPNCVSTPQSEHIRQLSALYEKALDECPALIRTALELMGTNQMCVPGFDMDYQGKVISKE